MRVLIADDDPVTVQMIAAVVRGAGMEVVTALDAMQASMQAARASPDVMLLDIQMPGGTGLGVLRRLRASCKTSGLPVIAMTGTADEQTRAETKALGALDCLEKPLDLRVLVARLRQLAAGAGQGREGGNEEAAEQS
jgi:DNA-binding response OmpR family regulator